MGVTLCGWPYHSIRVGAYVYYVYLFLAEHLVLHARLGQRTVLAQESGGRPGLQDQQADVVPLMERAVREKGSAQDGMQGHQQ